MTLLKQMEIARRRQREALRQDSLRQLRSALRERVPSESVIVFGSILRQGKFNEASDVDIALENELPGMSIYQLSSVLAEDMCRPVDVVLLSECRFREQVVVQGERWTLRD
jgi:predicted nucleotidyltransferase